MDGGKAQARGPAVKGLNLGGGSASSSTTNDSNDNY